MSFLVFFNFIPAHNSNFSPPALTLTCLQMSARSALAGLDVDIPMADDETVPSSVRSSRRPRPALRRRSPPIASEDELSDSEISELERKLAASHSSSAGMRISSVCTLVPDVC